MINIKSKREIELMKESGHINFLAHEEIKKHLEKNPEWVSLYKKAEDLGRALADARGKTMKIMREYKDVATAQPSEKSDLK